MVGVWPAVVMQWFLQDTTGSERFNNLCRTVEVVTRQSSDWSQAPKASFSGEMEGSRHVCLDAARRD